MSNIEKDIKRCEELIKPEHANWIGISNQLAIAHVVERIKELEAKQKEMCEEYCPKTERIKELETKLEFKQWGDLDNIDFEEYMKNFIPKQKIKDLSKEIQEEYNEVQGQFDYVWNKKSKDDYDRYKLQEFSAMQQQLGFFIGKLEELLEDK